MHKFLIIALGLASLGVLTESASAAEIKMTPAELKDLCDKKDGKMTDYPDGSSNCQIGGTGGVKISCSKKGNCIMEHIMVFGSKSSTHGPIGQAPGATTLGSGGNNSSAAGNSGASTLPGSVSSNAPPTAKKGGGSTALGGVGGGGSQASGRPPLRQQ